MKNCDTAYAKELYKEGKYFKESIHYYHSIYTSLLTQRSALFLCMILIICAVFISLDSIRHTFSVIRVPFSIYAKDQVNFIAQIKKIGANAESFEESVVKYFASKYIIVRESYDYNDFLDENIYIVLNKVKSLSTHKIFREFEELIDPNINVNSPILLYKSSVKRVVDISDVKLKSVAGVLEGALVSFTAIELHKDKVIKDNYIAEIEFITPDLYAVFKENADFSFFVTSYKAKKIQ